MDRAIRLAQQSPNPHPNPRVGAVITDPSGRLISEGFHSGPGLPHAEVIALEHAGERAFGATVYVTLEPCSHHGRTPPCADALISAGVARVVVGAVDPDTRVSGTGIERLRSAGIEVTEEDGNRARTADPAYFHHRQTGMPLVTVKWAMTLDGSAAASDGTSQWITGDGARAGAHRLRSDVDGIVVGAGTLRADDPLLDVRLPGYQGTQPRPVLVAGRHELPEAARVWSRDPIVISVRDRPIPSGDLIRVPGTDDSPDPVATCESLAEAGLISLLLEGGPSLAGSWWRAGVVDRGVVYIGAKVGGGVGISPMSGLFATLADAAEVEFESVQDVSEDAVIVFKRKR